jgi:hypothetical protein
VNSIYDLLIYPTEGTYDIKDVTLIFMTAKGERKRKLLENDTPQFSEEELTKWIESKRLFYE